jgi:hypothetical protein
MKRVSLIISAILLSIITTYSQNEVDALRYSQTSFWGTARAQAMGGAFGALGADLSALSYNPAGVAIYRSNEFSITPSMYLGETDAGYFGSSFSDTKYNFNLNNIGYVGTYKANDFIYDSGDNQIGWMNTNFAVGYNRLNNFHRNILIEGVNPFSSYVDVLFEDAIASGVGVDEYGGADGYADLVYDSDFSDDVVTYTTDFEGTAYGQTQSKSIRTEGSMGEYYVAFGANYSHKLYLGGSIGIQTIRYEENTDLTETDPDDVIPNFISMNYHEHLKTSGNGFNFKFGMIYRPIDLVRIGLAVHTPTFFDLEEEYSYNIESVIEYSDGPATNTAYSPENTFEYELQTPFKAMGSLGFVIKKYAILSIDYEFVDYSKSRLRSDTYSFTNENKNVDSRYTATSNIRIGGEFRNGPFRLRAGYGLYGSPYASTEANSDATFSTYSGGFGIRDQNFFFDVAYVYSTISEKYFMYGTEESVLDKSSSNVIATIGFKF